MKKNDWIVASINNPTYDPQDFKYLSGMTLDNTQMLTKDEYTKSPFIQNADMFKDKNGDFSQSLFDTFYKDSAQKFSDFSTENQVDDYQYSMWDVTRPDNAKIKNPNFNITKEKNPEHISIGVSGINQVADSGKSMRELAQDSKIYDPATGKFLDKSVNDLSLWNDPVGYFKSIFGDPLVYATYDKDTEEIDPTTGNKVVHKKGEWKVNDEGEYYTEKLDGRSLIGKQVVSALDYLTPENASINKYDFFDSDDLEKSVGGTIAKNVAAVVPMFIPYVNVAYSGLMVGREIAKSLPMMYGMVQGLSGSDNTDSKLLNTIAAYGQVFTGSTSDYASQNAFSFENFGSLASDVALQWGQQKFIANTFSKLTSGGNRAIESAYAKAQKEYIDRASKALNDAFEGKISGSQLGTYIGTTNVGSIQKDLINTGKWADTAFGKAAINKYLPSAQKLVENRMRAGQDLSLVYMAIISNTDVYESVLEKGGTPQEAAAIALGSTIGMYSVDKYLGLGEMFFNDEPARKAIRQAARKNAEALMESAGIKDFGTDTKKGIMGLIQRGVRSGRKAVSDYESAIKDRTLGFAGKALGEGLEEVAEELVSDTSKSIGELAGKLGYFSQSDYGAWENAFDRYAMSFLGGAVGGGMFYGVDAVQNRNNKSTKDFQNDLTYLLRQGRKSEILAEVDRLKRDGKLGSRNLSFRTTTDENGNSVYLTATDEKDSQSEYIYNTLKNTINQLDLVLNENQINLTEDQLFDRMVQGEYRANALSDFLKGDKEQVKDLSYITKYQEDFQNLVNAIENADSKIQEYISSTPDPAKRGTDFQEKLQVLKEEKQKLLDQRDYLFGEGSLGYVEKMLFAMDTGLSGRFMPLNYHQFVRERTGKSVKDLTEQEQVENSKAYDEYSKSRKKVDLDEAFQLYKSLEKKINPTIQQVSENVGNWVKNSQKFIDNLNSLEKVTFDTRLEGETDEAYNNRNTKLEGESNEEFKARQDKRIQELEKLSDQKLADWIDSMSSLPLDRNQFRVVEQQAQVLKKNLAQRIIQTFQINDNPELTHKIWNLLETSDLKDVDKVKENIKKLIKDNIEEQVGLEYAGRSMYDDFTWEGFRGVLHDMGESTEGYLTYGDLYKILKAEQERAQAAGEEFNPQALMEKLSNNTLEFDINSSEKQNAVNVDFLQWYSMSQLDDAIRDSKWTTPIEITDNYLDNEINERLDDLYLGQRPSPEENRDPSTGLESRINKIVNNILDNSLIQALSKLENKAFSVNPAFSVIDTISKISTNSKVNISDFLEQLYSQYQNGENAQSFQLTDQQQKVLTQFMDDVRMALAFIHAASDQSSYTNPVGHNKAINEFIQNHKKAFNTDYKLPEISEDYANFLLNEASTFLTEASNWIELSNINTSNKARKFTVAEQQYVKTALQFYSTNRDAFKINPDLDLLEGYEDLSLSNTLLNVAQVEQLLYNNYRKAVANGATIETILDTLLPKITDLKALPEQLTSKLDENLDYSKLTGYDKLEMVISSFALSPKQFYSQLLNFVKNNNNLAPLSVQEYVSRMALAQQSDPELTNKVLDYLSDKLKLSLPVLKNTSIVLGLGGAGKTAAVARLCSIDGDNTWLCGPVQSQVDTLINNLPKGTGKTKEELMSNILGPEQWAAFKSSFTKDKDGNWKTDGKFGSVTTGLQGNKTFKLKDDIKVSKVENAPKLIIIDEATHFNTAELQLISKFAQENGSQVLLLGDDHQNGALYQGLMMNLDREVALAWRTPKLFISLRDNNTQKSNNLLSLVGMIDKLDNAFSSNNEEATAQELLTKVIPNFGFNYYNKEAFYGELLTKEVPQDIMDKIPSENTIGFIGTSESPSYKYLKDSGKKVTLIDPISVQGQEFDYVIVDKDWNLKDGNAASLYFFLRDLYTMISRSRKGTIVVQNGDLSKFHSIENDLTGTTSIKNAISQFRETRLPIIQSIVDNLDEYSNQPSEPPKGPDNKVEGTNSTTDQLEPEKEPQKDNDTFNSAEVDQSEAEEQDTLIYDGTPVRCYSNVSYSGIPKRESNAPWTNVNNSNRDLGIFINNTDIIKDGKDKDAVVRKLLQLKCIFNYGVEQNYNLLPKEIRDRFSKESFNNAEYYISVENPTDSNKLVGLTDLDDKKRTINGKVITLVARISDKDGKEWEVTLGGLANPQTWKENEENIRKSIQKRIDNKAPNSEQLKSYLDKLHDTILAYEGKIAEISKENQMIRINKPEFSGMTTLVKSKDELRLQSIDPESNASPFNAACQYAVKSDVYVLTGDIPGVNPDLKGKPVMFVSSNMLLDSSQLRDLYVQQKNDPSLVPQVRMIVLDNMGVSFDSLYRKKYQDVYTTSTGEAKYYFPFEAEPMGLRMYRSVWNFRANLKQFLKAYNNFKETSGLSQDDIIKLCKLDNETYNKLRGDNDYLSEADYRNQVDEDTKKLLKPIWDFNDRLKDYREFRLGYSTNNGVYLRKLTNLTEDGPYQGRDLNNVIGVYINPDLAQQYEQVLDNLFNNVLEKVVPSQGRNPLTYITKELEKGWFRDVINNRKITIPIIDYSEDIKGNKKSGEIVFDKENALSAIPSLLVEVGKFLNFKSLNQPEFEDYLNSDPEGESYPSKYQIKFGDEVLDWWNIDKVFEKDRPVVAIDGSYDYNIPGINPYEVDPKNGAKFGIIDQRLNNLFGLMFHGLTSTKKDNDFTKGEIRATDADFKYGFFTDPLLMSKQGNLEENSVLTSTNRRLFGAKVYPGLPLITLSLNTYTPPKGSLSESPKTEQSSTEEKPEPSKTVLDTLLSAQSLGTLTQNKIGFTAGQLEDVQTVEDLKDLVDTKISANFKKFWGGQSSDISEVLNTPSSTQIEDGKVSVITIQQEINKAAGKNINISEVTWQQGRIIAKADTGETFVIDYSPSGAIATPISTTEQFDINEASMEDLRSQITEIIDNYTQPKNEDGLDSDTAANLKDIVNKAIKEGEQASDVNTQTKNRIINEIQEALENTDLDQEINDALTELKKTCKLI